MSIDSKVKWEALSRMWMSVRPPVAPSQQDVNNYLQIASKHAGRVGILGCTPVLRGAIRNVAARTISLDISRGMLQGSAAELPLAVSETMVECDWRQMPLRSASITALIGDKVFDNVLPHEWPWWIDEMSRVIVPGGYLVTRIAPRGRNSLSVPMAMTFEDAVVKWASVSDGGRWSVENACAGLWEDLLAASTQRESEHTGTQQTSRLLPEDKMTLLETWPLSSREGRLVCSFVDRYWTSRFFKWSAYTMEGVVRALDRAFGLSDALVAADYPEARRQPVLAFTARRRPRP